MDVTDFPDDLVRTQAAWNAAYDALAAPTPPPPRDTTALHRRLLRLSVRLWWHPYDHEDGGQACAYEELQRHGHRHACDCYQGRRHGDDHDDDNGLGAAQAPGGIPFSTQETEGDFDTGAPYPFWFGDPSVAGHLSLTPTRHVPRAVAAALRVVRGMDGGSRKGPEVPVRPPSQGVDASVSPCPRGHSRAKNATQSQRRTAHTSVTWVSGTRSSADRMPVTRGGERIDVCMRRSRLRECQWWATLSRISACTRQGRALP